ncbi:MAG: sigma-70 family RNA polymerase sigma factor [Alphaproteobacteria bacterium]|nr:MAG: sigma-70 family RNA polymerase sigma factor [Alphaproteobacteria bacterium]
MLELELLDSDTAPPKPLELIIEENRQAVRLAWTQSYPALVSRAASFFRGDRDRGEDLVSRATARILDFVARHDRPLREVGGLYFLVLRNLAIDEYRQARRGALLYDRTVDVHSEADSWRLPSCGTDVHAQLATSQALAALDALLDRLSGEARELFVQRFLEHRSYSEIAPSLGISEAGARKRVQKLRQALAGWFSACSREGVTDRRPARLSS